MTLVQIDDPLLPSAVHLTGPGAFDILSAATARAGGVLEGFTCTNMQYRPRSDLVVQYRATVRWGNKTARKETFVAAATSAGAPTGTVPVVAEAETGTLEVGVWRWPFDPFLRSLDEVVRRDRARALLANLATGPLEIRVIAYRPTERAVVRATDSDGRTWYFKIVRPERTAALVDRHTTLVAAGLPVPQVAAFDAEAGWIALDALNGPTLRERIKAHSDMWLDADELRGMVRRLRQVDVSQWPGARSRLRDAPAHAAVLATVIPEEVERLTRMSAMFESEINDSGTRPKMPIHGDLHEGQLIVDDDGAITGLLDVDDVGQGDPLDDVATPIAHLLYRATVDDSRFFASEGWVMVRG